MSWAMLAVIAAVCILVPVALYAVFASGRDSYQYARHYGKQGFSQAIVNEDEKENLGENISSEASARTNSNGSIAPVGPVREWPSEL